MKYLIGFATATTMWSLTAADAVLAPVPAPRLVLEKSLLGSAFDNPRTTPKIVGGERVPKDLYPWYAGLFRAVGDDVYHFCGGQLISPNFVLTAAHCEPIIGDSILIGALCPYTNGDPNPNCGQNFEWRTVANVIAHERYTSSITYDVGWDYLLVELNEPSSIEPVMLDSGSFSPFYPAGKSLWGIGLGLTDAATGTQASQLRHVELEYVPKDTCREEMKPTRLGEATICAEDSEKRADVCNGDSGGPLYDRVNKVLVGLTSYGDSLCVSTTPGAYARISDNFDWIQYHVCDLGGEDFPALCSQTTNPTSSPAPTSKWCRDAEVEVTLNVDDFPQETIFTLTELVQNDFMSYGSLGGFVKNEDHKGNFCLPVDDDQCYRFEIQDTIGDGIDLEGTDNDYCLKVDGELVECNANFAGNSESIIFPVENCAKTSACNITTYELEIETSSVLLTEIAIYPGDDDGIFVAPYLFAPFPTLNLQFNLQPDQKHSIPIDLCYASYKIVVANLGRTKLVLYDEEGDAVLTQDDLKSDGFFSSTLSARFGKSSAPSSALKTTAILLPMISLVVSLVI